MVPPPTAACTPHPRSATSSPTAGGPSRRRRRTSSSWIGCWRSSVRVLSLRVFSVQHRRARPTVRNHLTPSPRQEGRSGTCAVSSTSHDVCSDSTSGVCRTSAWGVQSMTSHERHQRLAGRLFYSCLRRLIRRRSFTFFPGAYHALYLLPAPNMLRPPFHIPLGAYEHGRLSRSFFTLCIAAAD